MVCWAHLNIILACIFRGFFSPELPQCIFTSGTSLVSVVNNTRVFDKADCLTLSLHGQGQEGCGASQKRELWDAPPPPPPRPATQPQDPGTEAASTRLIPATERDPDRSTEQAKAESWTSGGWRESAAVRPLSIPSPASPPQLPTAFAPVSADPPLLGCCCPRGCEPLGERCEEGMQKAQGK